MVDVTDKITKLLRLAQQQDNDNEAAVAFAHAQRLATLHGLDLDDIDTSTDDEPEPTREVGPIIKRAIEYWNKAVVWKLRIASAVAGANACRYFYRSGRSGRSGGIVAYGQAEDLETVATMYRAIVHQCDKLAKAAVREYSGSAEYDPLDREADSPRTYGRDFRLGFADKIGARLISARSVVRAERKRIEAESNSTTALVRIDRAERYLERVDTALDTARDSYGLRTGRGFTGSAHGAGYFAGRRAARSASLGRGKGIGE